MTKKNPLVEWQPKFKGGEYSPGDYQMPSPAGKGVADRSPTQSNVGQQDTEFSDHGDPFGGEFHDTAAMCDVDEDGVEHNPQGSHNSTHGEPNDGIRKKVGHDWPAEPKNSGGGVAEPFGGSRWSDGGEMKGGHGPSGELPSGGTTSMPSDGPITGTTGPQLGQVAEWNVNDIDNMIEDPNAGLQDLFDTYAASRDAVCVEDFQQLCDSNGLQISIDENLMLALMGANESIMFHEQADGDGPYWMTENCSDEVPDFIKKKMDCGDDDDDEKPKPKNKSGKDKGKSGKPFEESRQGVGSRHPFSGLMNEDIESIAGRLDNEGDPHRGPGPMGGPGGDEYRGNMMANECPNCQYVGEDEQCPECGMAMGSDADFNPELPAGSAHPGGPGPMDIPGSSDLEEPTPESDYGPELDGPDMAGFDSTSVGGGPPAPMPAPGGRTPAPSGPAPGAQRPAAPMPGPQRTAAPMESFTLTPHSVQHLSNFMESAKQIVNGRGRAAVQTVAEALNLSWRHYAGDINPNTVPPKVRTTIQSMMRKFPGFRPVSEDVQVMDRPEGTKIGGGEGPHESDMLPDQPGPDDITQRGGESYFDVTQTNTLEGTPTVKGTGKGMSEAVLPDVVRRNIARLTNHVKAALGESASVLTTPHKITLAFVVTEGKKKNKTPDRDRLSEAMADAEELLQLHSAADVGMLASFKDASGVVTMQRTIPLITINGRGPIMSEGRAVFRFARTAEAVAGNMVSEGVACRVAKCPPWGTAVAAKAHPKVFTKAFAKLQN